MIPGVVRDRLKPVRKWKAAYADSEDPGLFRKWLSMMLDPQRRYDLQEGYAESGIASFAGFFTYRYVFLFFDGLDCVRERPVAGLDFLKQMDREHNMLAATIRNEQLEDDLIDALTLCGVQLTPQQISDIREAEKTNTSSRRKDFGYYYDQATIDLVVERERFIIDKYGYEPPQI